jgi:RNA-directed DNA polymerase
MLIRIYLEPLVDSSLCRAMVESSASIARLNACGTKQGTPQRRVISPLLTNLFLYYTTDGWERRKRSNIPFERHADDIIVHCKSEKQAQWLREATEKGYSQYKLEVHPKNMKVVYCKDEKRSGHYPDEKFDFLGFTFRPRLAGYPRGRRFRKLGDSSGCFWR